MCFHNPTRLTFFQMLWPRSCRAMCKMVGSDQIIMFVKFVSGINTTNHSEDHSLLCLVNRVKADIRALNSRLKRKFFGEWPSVAWLVCVSVCRFHYCALVWIYWNRHWNSRYNFFNGSLVIDLRCTDIDVWLDKVLQIKSYIQCKLRLLSTRLLNIWNKFINKYISNFS